MKLDFRHYEAKFEAVTFMFDLLRHAIKELGTEGFRRYMRDARKPKETNFKKLIGFLAADRETSSIIPHVTKLHRRKLSVDLPITPGLKWVENKGNALLGVNASELVLRVALLEAFLQDIHRHALLAKPQLLSHVKPKRSILLKDLFRAGFERVKADEIRRQVREANRLRTKERVKFFEQRLQLNWGDQTTTARVCELIELRHQLVHAAPDKPITPKDIEDARTLFLLIPRNCFDKACSLYSAWFKK